MFMKVLARMQVQGCVWERETRDRAPDWRKFDQPWWYNRSCMLCLPHLLPTKHFCTCGVRCNTFPLSSLQKRTHGQLPGSCFSTKSFFFWCKLVLNSVLKLLAAIIFISIGVIASFFCAIVDGIIASEFIVSVASAWMHWKQMYSCLDGHILETRWNFNGMRS